MSNVIVGTVVDPPKAITIFGREPAAWLGLLEALIATLVVFRLGITFEASVLLMAFVSAAIGAYSAWATKDTMLGVIVGLVKSGIGLWSYYGLQLDEQQVAAIVTVSAVLVGFYQRTQTSPVAAPVDPSPEQVVPVDPPPSDTPFANVGDGVEVPADGRTYELGNDGAVRPLA